MHFSRTLLFAPLVLACAAPSDPGAEEAATIEALLAEPDSIPTCAAADASCLLPWPSSRYLVDDPSTPTGHRVALPAEHMPVNVYGVPVDPTPWNQSDGFSAMSTIVVQLPGRVDPAQLNDWQRVGDSLASTSATILLDATTGRRVPHFAEIEPAADADPAQTTLYIRPAARLREDRHYVVALRNLRLEDGSRLVPGGPLARLQHLIDHRPRTHRELATDVLIPLLLARVPLADLVMAWDFHTGSGESAWGDLVAMRDDAEAIAGAAGLGCTVTAVIEDPENPEVFRQIEGTFRVPFYLEADVPGARLARDAAGRPVRTAFVDAPFTAIIPRSVADAVRDGGDPVRLVTYGHGLFSTRYEILTDFMATTANTHPMVVVATETNGLAIGDQLTVVSALTELSQFSAVMDRVSQSIIDTVLLPRSFAAGCGSDPALMVDGRPVLDPSERYYYGNSQGAALGMSVAALSTDIDRFALGVGGISYPVMLPRSVHWPSLESVLAAFYPRRIDRDLAMAMFAHHWDRIEGATFAPHVLADPLPGSTPKRVLFQVGLNDGQTPNVGSELAGRTLGLPQPASTASPVYGLTSYDTPTAESAYVVYDYGVDPLPTGPVAPAAPTGVHEMVRRDPRAQAQIDAFLRPDGIVVDTCGGPCVAPSP